MEGRPRHLRDIEDALSEYVAEFDPDAVALCEAPGIWDQLARMRRLADSAMTLLRARSTRRASGSGRGSGAAEQMAAKAGSSVSSAKSMLQTSDRVKDQPKTVQAMRSG